MHLSLLLRKPNLVKFLYSLARLTYLPLCLASLKFPLLLLYLLPLPFLATAFPLSPPALPLLLPSLLSTHLHPLCLLLALPFDPLNTLLPALSLTLSESSYYPHLRDLVSLLILLNLLRLLYLHLVPLVTKRCTRRELSSDI
jgi:hypothetical protein